jgi:hypothetical protein
MPRTASPNSIDTRIAKRIARSSPGSVFTPTKFASAGSRDAIDKALQRQVRKGALRRLSRGLYDKPRHDKLLGALWPSVDDVLKAVTDRGKLRVQPAGAYAANLLGLSEQVPARVVLLTDGTSRSLRAGPMRIELKRTSPRNMAAAGRLSGLVFQALKSIGPSQITRHQIDRLRRNLPLAERRKLLKDLDLAPSWMWPFLRELAEAHTSTAGSRSPRKASK